MPEPWLSADDIAAHLGITKDTVYTWIAGKHMPAHKMGRLWKFQASEVDDWVRRGGATSREDEYDPGAIRGVVGGSPYADAEEEPTKERR